MNRLVTAASKFAVAAHRHNQHAPASAARFVVARHFSDDSGLTLGTVKQFASKGGYGFIIPDGVDPKSHTNDDLIFIHRNDIKALESDDGEKFMGNLKPGMRVQFKISAAPEGKKHGKGKPWKHIV